MVSSARPSRISWEQPSGEPPATHEKEGSAVASAAEQAATVAASAASGMQTRTEPACVGGKEGVVNRGRSVRGLGCQVAVGR